MSTTDPGKILSQYERAHEIIEAGKKMFEKEL